MENVYIDKVVTWAPGENTLYAGTPLDANARPANNETAIGIVAEDLHHPDKTARVLTAGSWDEDLHRGHIVLKNRTKRALKDITFRHPPIPNDKKITNLTEDGELAFSNIIEVLGIPTYVDDVTEYSDYGLTETGWYAFSRILARANAQVTAGTTVEGAAGYIATVGNDYIDVAVRFEVAAMSKKVVISWGESTDTYVFKATDLAIRNLDYRTTFYVYDATPFVTWSYGIATDATFQEDKAYFLLVDGAYVKQNPTIGDALPPVYYEDLYTLTEDETFAENKTYYTESGGVYTAAEVTAGEAVTADTYYEHSYVMTSDTQFIEDKAYYTLSGTTYSAAEVTAGADLPDLYYVHTKASFEGMTRNITYRLDTVIDCPVEFVLPEIDDDDHGCWFEIRLQHAGTYSSTLIPPEGVKIATEHTQAETKGINMVDLHYSSVGGAKVWRFMNTHSTFTADAPALVSIAFRADPSTTEYSAGDTLDLTGAEVVATYADNHTKLVTASCTFSPASGATLTSEDTTLTATYTEGNVTATATVDLTIS